MGIYIGTDKLKEVYLGTNKVKEIYLGTSLAYQAKFYLMKNGEAENGYSFTSEAKWWESSTSFNARAPEVSKGDYDDYVYLKQPYNGSRGPTGIYYTSVERDVIKKYSKVCLRVAPHIFHADEFIHAGVFNTFSSNDYIKNNLLATEKYSTVKEEPETVILSKDFDLEQDVRIGLALISRAGAVGVDTKVYDIWLE